MDERSARLHLPATLLLLVVLLLLSGQSNGESIRVFRSIHDLSEEGQRSEAKLVDERRVNISSLTLCLRFNFKLLGSSLIRIDDNTKKVIHMFLNYVAYSSSDVTVLNMSLNLQDKVNK